MPIKNDGPYSHTSHHGTKFSSDHCDLRSGVKIERRKGTNLAQLLADVCEFTGYHACVILPELNSFQGYDTVSFHVTEEGKV